MTPLGVTPLALQLPDAGRARAEVASEPPLVAPARRRTSDGAVERELAAHRAVVERELHQRFFGLGIEGVSDALEYQLDSGGKRLRPALGLWLARRLGADVEAVLPFALAVEFMHNVFLVHDDIEDGDRFRRDREALWARFGTELALNTSDWMLARAYALIDETPGDDSLRGRLYRAMTSTLVTTAEGQARDLSQRASASLTVDAYLETASMKTGRYFALAWVGAALVAGRSLDECEPLWDAGRRLGASFQVCDDLIDMTLGKGRVEIGCDVREGKPTVLLAYALETPLASRERARLLDVLAQPREDTTRDDVAWVARLYDECGATERAERLGRRLTAEGLRAFEGATWLPPGVVDDVRRLASVILRRRL